MELYESLTHTVARSVTVLMLIFRLSEKMAMASSIMLPVRSQVQSQYTYIEFVWEIWL